MNNLSVKKRGLWLLIIALGFIAIGISTQTLTRPAIAPGDTAGAGHFSLIIDYGDSSDFYKNVPFDTNETLFSATLELVNERGIEFDYEDYGDMGMLVVNIGGKSGGDGNAYWQYWVNEEYAQVGASVYGIQDGDQIKWMFTDARQ